MSGTRPPSVAEKIDWLRLIRSENVGPITFRRLLDRHGRAADALDALPDIALRGGRGDLRVCGRAEAEAEIERALGLGARLLAWGEADYPPLLAQIEDSPPLIYAIGHPRLLRKRAVAVVGARNASANGRALAGRLARDLGCGGLLVVSGMARGIDAAAHRGALPSGTVAVLAGGVDNVYPKENADLYESLRETGAIISEAPPGTVPRARHFPGRNRLISGICRGVLVVEAAPRSGSLITARLALDQGREVFAVPGSPLDPRSRGANDLLRQGACLVESADEILDALRPDGLRLPIPPPDRPAGPVDDRRRPDDPPSTARDALLGLLGPSPATVDELVRQCQLSTAVVSSLLLELELSGRLERHPGNRVSLIPMAEDHTP